MTQVAEPPYGHTPGRVRFTREQCKAMSETGILQGHYELIDGEIISKMGQNPPHGAVSSLLNAWLTLVFGALFVRTQSSIDIGEADPDHNDPEPDAAVTVAPATAYFNRLPGPADLVLVCEVSDSTARLDRTAKAALYALAGIIEYWIVDIPARQLIVHRQPATSGYAVCFALDADGETATLARPNNFVRVSDLLPPSGLPA
jgi:Uma2 family endonuclease